MVNYLYLCLLLLGGTLVFGQTYENCLVVDEATNYRFYWNVTESNIFGAIEGRYTGWIGLGIRNLFNPDPTAPYDLIIGWVQPNGIPIVRDYWVTGTNAALDTQQNVQTVGGSFSAGVLRIDFSRLITSPDNAQDLPLTLAGNNQFVWAFSNQPPQNEATIPAFNFSGSFAVNLLQPSTCLNQTVTPTQAPTTLAPPTATPTVTPTTATPTVTPTTATPTVPPTTATPTVPPTTAPPTVPSTTEAPTTIAPTTVAPTTSVPEPSPTPIWPEFSEKNTIVSPDKQYTLGWAVVEDGEPRIYFRVEANTAGWVGVGLNTEPSMIGGDLYVGWVRDGVVTVTDRKAHAHAEPPLDTDQPGCQRNILTPVWGNVSQTTDGTGFRTTIIFYRYLESADTVCDYDIRDEDLYVLWAYGDDSSVRGEFGITKHVARGFVHFNLIESCAEWQPPNHYLIRTHAILMVLSWLFLLVLGIVIARYMKNVWSKWAYLHIGTQVLALILILAAFLSILAALDWELRFSHAHNILGFILLLLTIIQPILGALSYIWYSPVRDSTPFFPDVIHWWWGKILIVIAIINIFLGLSLFVDTLFLAYLFLGIWIGVTVIFAIVMEAKVGQTRQHRGSSRAGYMPMEQIIPDQAQLDDNSDEEQADPTSSFSTTFIVAYFALSLILIMALGFVIVYDYSAHYTPMPSSMSLCLKFTEFNEDTPTRTWCKAFAMPLDKAYHLRSISVTNDLMDNNSVSLNVSHLIFYLSRSYPGSAFFDCSETPDHAQPMFVWSRGSDGEWEFPPQVGFKVGREGTYFAIVQINFANPVRASQVRSGVHVWLTSDTSITNAGLIQLTLGDFQSPRQDQVLFPLNTTCRPSGWNRPDNEDAIIFGAITLMSRNGLRTFTTADDEVVLCDEDFDPRVPAFSQETALFYPSTEFLNYCAFNLTAGRDFTCTTFLAYYPYIDGMKCDPRHTEWTAPLECPSSK